MVSNLKSTQHSSKKIELKRMSPGHARTLPIGPWLSLHSTQRAPCMILITQLLKGFYRGSTMITSSKDNHLRNKIDNGTVFSRKINSFSEWKHHMGNRFGRLSVSTREAHFHGRVRSRSIEDATVTEIAASPHQVQRNLCQTSDLEPRLLKLSLLLDGHGLVTQDGRTAALSPGDVAVYDTGKPYSLEFTDDMRVLIMIFPHQMIGLPMKLVSTATAVRLPGDSGIGKVISPFMEHIATNIELLDGINGERILRSALDLISALLSAELTRTATQVDSDQTKIAEIEHFIDRNLGESHLSTRLIATAHYISARKDRKSTRLNSSHVSISHAVF